MLYCSTQWLSRGMGLPELGLQLSLADVYRRVFRHEQPEQT
ncbi:MAG TPA: hypothetical protein VKR06_29215 [Ktedonosporobacter sp.]|nr:hypothetical protein [Ktedonosporobacter sp.]